MVRRAKGGLLQRGALGREGRLVWSAKGWILLVCFLFYLRPLRKKKVYRVLGICEELLERENSKNTKQGPERRLRR